MAESNPKRSLTSSVTRSIKSGLEVISLVMMTVVCVAMLITMWRGGWGGQNAAALTATRRPQRPPEPKLPTVPVSLDGAKLRGSQTAKVAIIEYSDFQCPYCGRFARETLPTIERDYVDSGKVLFAFRQFPLETIHSSALGAAEATECASRQNQFWQMHDLAFADQTHLDADTFAARAKKLFLDTTAFQSCLKTEAAERVHDDAKTGGPFGVTGTPTFILGTVQLDGQFKAVKRLSGALSVPDFKVALDEILSSTNAVPKTK